MRIRSKLALILFGMILGALSYRGLNSLFVDRAPAVTQLPAAGVGTGPVKWENDTVVPLTKILPSDPGKATITDGVAFSGGPYRSQAKAARIRVVAYASSAEANEAVIAVFLVGVKSPLALASKPTADNKREKIELGLDIPKVAGQLDLEFRAGPGQPGSIVFNGPENAPERALTVVTVTE